MAYLAKEERRKAIILATLEVVRQKGFAGITTRAVAKQLGAATGILHHHFKSLSDLKCETLRFLSHKSVEKWHKFAHQHNPAQALLHLISFEATPEEKAEISVWISAADEATRDPEFALVYAEETNKSHKWLCANLEDGLEAGEYKLSLPVELAAWKLMALIFNLYDLSSLPATDLSPEMALAIIKEELKSTLGLQDKDLMSPLLAAQQHSMNEEDT